MFIVLISSIVVISVSLTPVVTHTVIVEPEAALHARCGKAGEVKIDPTGRTVWILGKGQCIHVGKQVASLIVAGNSRERDRGIQGWGGCAPSLGGLLGGGEVARAGHSHG